MLFFFWESANDPPQIIDQYLAGLENSGFFASIKAMIVGQTNYNKKLVVDRPLNDLPDYCRVPLKSLPKSGKL